MENAALKTEGQSFFEPTPARFMRSKEELLMILLPIAGIIIAAGQWLLGQMGVVTTLGYRTDLIAELVFIDGVHIVLSYILLASLPELRAWSKSDDTRAKTGWLKGFKPNMRALVIAGFLGAIIYVLKVSPVTSTMRGMATTWLFLELLGPAQHTLAQVRGISFCYNSSIRRNFQFTEEQKAQALRSEKMERFFFSSIVVGEIMYWIPDIFEIDKLVVPGIDTVVSLGGFIVVASAVALVVNAFHFPHQQGSRKLAFLSRILLFPLKMITDMGGLFVRAAHGTEYLFIYRRMVQGSKIPQEKRTRVYLVTTLICLLYIVPFCITSPEATEGFTGWKVSDTLLAYAVFGTFIIRFTHFYMDSQLFKMSDMATRLAVGPILTTNPDDAPVAVSQVAKSTDTLGAEAVGPNLDKKSSKKSKRAAVN